MSRRFRNLILLLAVVLGFAGRALAADTMLTISGTEQKVAGAWDTAKITISFTDKSSNTYTEQVTYGQFSTPASIASSFGALFSNTYFQNGELCAFAVGGNIYFHLKGSDTFGWPTITIQDTLTTSPSFSVSTASWQAPAAGPTPLGITWPNPVIVPYGTPLAALQPFAKIYANTGAGKFEVAGTFTYTSATPGVSLGPTLTTLGTQSLYYTFIPADTTNYPITNCASSNCAISLNVVTAAPAIVWPPPAAITYNTALSAAQLNAMVSVSGTLSACLISTTPSVANTCYYSQPLGTILTPGKQTLTVTYTPTNTTDFASVTATVILNVNKAEPTITWSPAAMSSATLTTAQLNASSSLAGSTFTYSVGAKTVTAGTVLPTGENLLTVTATPPGASAQYFEPVTRTVPITVGAGATFDQGTATLTVGGVVASTYSYKQYDTPSSIAAGLAAGLLPCTATNSNPQPCVTLAAVDNSLYMQATPAAVSAYASIGSSTDFSYSLNIPQGTGFTEPSFQVTPPSGNLDGGASSGAAVTPIYTFCVAGSGNPDCTLTGTGYDPAGNLLSYTDAGTNGPIMGTWKFQYDTLNRLAGATDNQPGNTNTNYCWSYDAFGNRQQQAGSNALFTNSVGAPTCTAANGASFNNVWARYTVDGTTSTPDNGKNQVTATPAGNVIYDPSGAGYILNDAINQYLYDGEGRICAVAATNAFGATLYTGYLYDADGTRVAKGTITSWSCDPTLSGFKTTNDYLLGPGGEQLTEMGIDTTVSGSTATNTLTWQHANIWAGGKLLGTYDKNGLHFYFDDPLGTRRAQTDYAGVLEQTCASLPYGDLLSCTGGDLQAPTEHHFTGKERDAESGNDYFGARYYASTMGRFLSPDWSAKVAPVPYAKLDDPQSLNLYAYMLNNPLGGVDADGHDPGEDIQGSQDLSRAVSLYFAAHPTVAFTVAHPLIAWQVGWVQNGWTNISTNSQRFAAGMGMTERETRLGVHEGSERNAMRHTIWQATLTAKFGHGTATQIGNAHEENPNVDLSIRTFSGGGQAAWDRADQTVDLLNNQIGRAIGDANPGASMNQLAGAALDYYHSTGLYTASQGADGTVSISQTRLSDQQYAAGKQALQKMDQNGR